MSWLAPVVLAFLHALYRLVLVFKSILRSDKEPRPITAERSKLPSHLALALLPSPEADDEDNEQYMLNSVEKVAGWCQIVGIRQLSVYDREGTLAKCSLELRERLHPQSRGTETEESPVECDIQYPLTPPPSDDADSRPLSPRSGAAIPKLGVTTIRFPANPIKSKRRASTIKRRRIHPNDDKMDAPSLILHIISYQSGKPAIAAAARTFLRNIRESQSNSSTTTTPPLPSIQDLNGVLEGEHGFPSPDLMIVHRRPPVNQLRSPVELVGFPPWQSRLTEIYWDLFPSAARSWRKVVSLGERPSIEEAEFRRALDEFASAEMRLGK